MKKFTVTQNTHHVDGNKQSGIPFCISLRSKLVMLAIGTGSLGLHTKAYPA